MALSNIDELNSLSQREVELQLTEYFQKMDGITDEQLEKRVLLGEDIFELMKLFFGLVMTSATVGAIQDLDYYVSMIENRYSMMINTDDYLNQYIHNFALEVVNTTFEHKDEDYYLSDGRALSIAQNEPNSVLNYEEYEQAIENGYEYKKWITEKDNKVRKTHKEVSDKVIPIKQLFHVGNSLMRFPHDTEYGAEPKEYIHCRCNVEYTNKDNLDDTINAENKYSDHKLVMPLNLTFFGEPSENKTRNSLLTEAEKWEIKLTTEERRAIVKYTKNSGDEKPNRFFEVLNGMLRGDIPKEDRIMRYAPIISSGLSKFNLEDDIIVYRALDKNYYINKKVGEYVIIDQFVSTSIFKSCTLDKPIMIKIHIPKGTNGAYVENLSKYKKQKEFLIDKNYWYKIISVDDNFVEMRLIR